jgi:hypothetical protein
MEAQNHKKSVLAAMLLMLAASLAMRAGWAAPVEVYGRLPSLEEVALSPDGARIAFIRTSHDDRLLAIHDFTKGKIIGGLRVGTVKLRSISWADNDHLLVITSVTTLPWGFMGPEREWYQLLVYDVVKNRSEVLPNADRLTHDAPRVMNATWGQTMVRRVDGHTVLFIPGYDISSDRTAPALFRVDLETDGEKMIRQGSQSTVEWLVGADGEIAAEEDYDDKGQRWWILQHRDGRMQEIASGHEAIDYPRLLGFGPEPGTLLMRALENGNAVWRLLSLQDGSFGPPMAERKVMEAPIEDPLSYRLIGGVHVDDVPHYVFFGP